MGFKVHLRMLADSQMQPTGRWRMTITSDLDEVTGPLCACKSASGVPGHATSEEARTCAVARSRLNVAPFKGNARLPRAKGTKVRVRRASTVGASDTTASTETTTDTTATTTTTTPRSEEETTR